MIGKKRKLIVGAIIAIVAAIVAGIFGANRATAAPIYGDTQITASHQSVDAITGISADAWEQGPVTCPTTPPVTATFLGSSFSVFTVPSVMCVQFAGLGSHGSLTWHIDSETNIPPSTLISIDQTSGLLTVTPTAPVITPANNQNISLTVSATDGVAKAFEMLTAVPVIVAGHLTAIDVTAVTDDVTLIGTNNNVTDAIDFVSTPTGAGFTLANAPNGVALNGSHLVATNARPDEYSGLSVTATDTMGAVAVDTFKVEVDGAIVGNDTPRLSHGHAVAGINSSRENVFFVQSGSPSWDHFTIVGPGAINGHQGWVHGQLGLNEAVYGGLLAGHGYTVFYQPVTGPGSITPWPGAHWGYVYFISGH
jgi:hypothetical protein